MSIVSYLVIDLVKTGLNRIYRRPRHGRCCYARSLAHLFLIFFFFGRVFLVSIFVFISSPLISSPITFFPSAWHIHARDQMRANRSTRARCAQVCAVRNILGILKESRFSTTGQPKEICVPFANCNKFNDLSRLKINLEQYHGRLTEEKIYN